MRNAQHLADHYAGSVSQVLSSPRARLTRGQCLVTAGTGSKAKLDLSHGALGPGENRYLDTMRMNVSDIKYIYRDEASEQNSVADSDIMMISHFILG